MQCHIISIGDELLIGDTVNTNACWLGQVMTESGVDVTHIYAIGDDLLSMKKILKEAMATADIVITTGGLGPTDDDITKKAVAEHLECDLVIHEPTLAFIKNMLKKRNMPFGESNYRQAEVLDCCEVLFNSQGTAPGMWIERNHCQLAILPGVPFEMKHLVKQKVLPKVREITKGKKVLHSHFILTAGVGESTLSDNIVSDCKEITEEKVDIAYLPNPQGTQIRISARALSKEEFRLKIEPVVSCIKKNGAEAIVGEGKDLILAGVVGDLLQKKKVSLSVAESCTGGFIANSITNIPGCSQYMKGGVVSYSNEVKKDVLDVRDESLASCGAVSQSVALQMAKGVAAKLNTDIGLSTTGIAGPGGGTEEKPVGLVWISFWSRRQHFAIKAQFTNDRIINKERTAAVAFEVVRRCLLDIKKMPYGLKKQSA